MTEKDGVKTQSATADTTGWHVRCFQPDPNDPGWKIPEGSRLSMFRLEHGGGLWLTGPILVEAKRGDEAQSKILYEKTRLAFLLHPTDGERETLLAAFSRAAEALAKAEREQQRMLTESEARQMAADEIRQSLSGSGLRNDWQEGMD